MASFAVSEGLRRLPPVVSARGLQISGQIVQTMTALMRAVVSARINPEAAIGGPDLYAGSQVDVRA